MNSIIAANTHRFLLDNPKKDGVAWDISGATVTLFLRNPSGTTTSHAATAVTSTQAYFDGTTTTLGVGGDWQRWWHVVKSGIDLMYGPINFAVETRPQVS